MKKLIAFVLSVILLASCFVAVVNAYGTDSQTLIITHINTSNSTEGSAIIISGTKVSSIGSLGNFAWWSVYIFDWSDTDECFKLTAKYTNANNSDKSAVKIPSTGFAYCICVGNDYSSSGGINYKTDRIMQSNSYAATLSVGVKAYLYGVELKNGNIQSNGELWYAEGYESYSYLKIGSPVSGETAYNPNTEVAAKTQYIIKTNHTNSTHYASQDCNIFTSAFGSQVTNTYDFGWWDALVFCWDAENKNYVCVANDFAKGNGNGKKPMIPSGGFVIMNCYSDSSSSISNCTVGTQAWLYKESDGNYSVYLNVPADGKTQVAGPTNGYAQAVLNGINSIGKMTCTNEATTLTWNAVSGASKYIISINKSSSNTLGTATLSPKTVTTNSYTIDAGVLEVGGTYTVMLQACGTNGNSIVSVATLNCTTKTAANSSLAEKTVIAFGDSLTARTGWVGMLVGFIGTDVINAGVGGNTTNHAIGRYEEDVISYHSDVALVCFGMNDQAQVISAKRPNVSLETYRKNMIEIVKALQADQTDVVLICPHDAYEASGYYTPGAYGLNYAYGYMEEFCDVVRQIALEYGCDFIDIYTESQDEDMSKFLNAGDGVHQSSYGHQKWAEYVSNYLLAKYDGVNQATVTVECKNASGQVLQTYSFTAAIGSKMKVPAAEQEGLNLQNEEKIIEVSGDTTVTYTYLSESDYPIGDVDGTGKVDAKDYLKLKRYVLGTYQASTAEQGRMDVNGDGDINAKDYLMLKRFVLGTYSF